MPRRYIPERGDLVWCDFDPTRGHKQARQRPALVLSPKLFNQKVGLALVVPVTSTVRGHPFEVAVSGHKVSGMALIQQQRTIDYQDRKSTRLNSSHVKISYAVFCLKKKKTQTRP